MCNTHEESFFACINHILFHKHWPLKATFPFRITIFMNIKNKNQKLLLSMNSKFILRYVEEC